MQLDATRAIILAAGRGSRLGALTARRPKCLVPLAGRALLDWQIDALRAAGVRRLAVVRGYRARTIRRDGLHAFENPRWAREQMVASLACARDWLAAAPCVVAYGDVVFHPEAVHRLLAAHGDVAITYDLDWRALWAARFARPEDDAESLRVHDGHVVEIGGQVGDLDDVDGQFMGLVRFTPAGWARAEEVLAGLDPRARRTLQTTHLLQLLVERGAPVAAVPVRGRWCEVDGAQDLALYERALTSAGWLHDWRPHAPCDAAAAVPQPELHAARARGSAA